MFITNNNATDNADRCPSFEGVCNLHNDCRNVLQKFCWWIKCSFLYHKPSPHTTTPAKGLFIQQVHHHGQLRPNDWDCCANNCFAYLNFSFNKFSQKPSHLHAGVSIWQHFIIQTDLSGTDMFSYPTYRLTVVLINLKNYSTYYSNTNLVS